MTVTGIWRYPVKSMAGEHVMAAQLTGAGLMGDRIVQVYDRRGRMVTARAFPRLLQLHATLGVDGEPLVDGLPWYTSEVVQWVEAAVGPGARLVRSERAERFDVLPLLVCTDGSVAAFGRDARRLRPNLMLGGVEGLSERQWSGAILRLPETEVGLVDLRSRCVMTTCDPDTTEQEPEVLRDIARRFGGKLCLNATVTRAGRVEVGQNATLVAR